MITTFKEKNDKSLDGRNMPQAVIATFYQPCRWYYIVSGTMYFKYVVPDSMVCFRHEASRVD